MTSSVKKKLFPCLFYTDVLCSYRKSEKSGILNRCSKCRYFKQFLAEMEEEEAEFWAEVDKLEAEEGFRCPFDGKPCDQKPLGSCFGVESATAKVWKCSRFDVNRLPDGSLMKNEYLRLRGGGSVEC